MCSSDLVDARKWALARMSPKKYGDKIQQDVDVKAELKIVREIIK